MAWAVSPLIRVRTALVAAVALGALSLSAPLFFMSSLHLPGPGPTPHRRRSFRARADGAAAAGGRGKACLFGSAVHGPGNAVALAVPPATGSAAAPARPAAAGPPAAA
jgi:hypothetical protein